MDTRHAIYIGILCHYLLIITRVSIYKAFDVKPTRPCSDCGDYEICEDGKCVCPLQDVTTCKWVECSRDKDCFPGSCIKKGSSTCKCHGDFSGSNCKSGFKATISGCNITLSDQTGSSRTVHGNFHKSGTFSVTTYVNNPLQTFSQVEATFFVQMTTPIKSSNRCSLEFKNTMQVGSVSLTCKSQQDGPVRCSGNNRNFRGERFKITTKPELICDGDTRGGVSTIATVVITPDRTKPTFQKLQDAIFFCDNIAKTPNLTVYWRGWSDNDVDLTYDWAFHELELVRNKLLPKTEVADSGTWRPGDRYPSYSPPEDKQGMYLALVTVKDSAGNLETAKTWILYDSKFTKVVTTETPITIKEAIKNAAGRQWITTLKTSSGTDELTLLWTGHFNSTVHPDAFKTIDITGNVNKPGLWKEGNLKKITRYQYAFVKDDHDETPIQWTDSSVDEVTVDAPRDDKNIFTAWVRAFDSFGNNLTDHQMIYVDSSPPNHTQTNFAWNTDRRIDGLKYYTSSIMVTATDVESGIYQVGFELAISPPREGFGTALSMAKDECKKSSDCTCSITGRCQLGVVEAPMDNCVFKGVKSGKYSLKVKVYNEALLPSAEKSIEINFDENTTEGLHEYPAPEMVNATKEEDDTSVIHWQFIQACFKRLRVEAWYITAGQNRTLNLTSDSNSTEINGLSKNSKVEFFIRVLYEGDIYSEIAEWSFTHDGGLSAGEVVGIVLGLLIVIAIAVCATIYLLRFRKAKPPVRRPLPTPPVEKYAKKTKAPLPQPPMTVTNGVLERPPPPLPTDTDDEIEVYGNVDVNDSLRVVSHQLYSLGKELGSGRLAVVKLATLKDSRKHQKVAAKMSKNKNSDRDKIILRAKLNFMATAVNDHPNVVNIVAADIAEPILFLELCEDGGLSDWVKQNENVTQSVKDKMMLFCLDIACGLQHLHSLNVIHRRMGIRNVLLSTSPKRQIARITGFGPLESEVNSDKEDTRIPVRWMPPESLERQPKKPRVYTRATDMWSYAVTVWEIFSKGLMPFKGMKAPQVKEKLRLGDRLPQPPDCPQTLFSQVVQPCWKSEPRERPTAESVCNTLTNMTSGRRPPNVEEIELDVYENANPSYQQDELYENNVAMHPEPPMYLDMCV